MPHRTTARPHATRTSPVGVLLAVALLAAGLVAGVAPGAQAAARVTVSGPDGGPRADARYSTTLTLSGSGFQSVKGGFGGIYVLFGWVDDPQGGSWRPSRGGQTGADYRYVPDSQTKDNNGFEKFVAFPGSDTEDAANGGELAADGTWSTTVVVPGPTFQTQDRAGTTVTVDCRSVQCGVITIGAHGVPNAHNETFTPVTFGAPGGSAAGSGAGSAGSGAGSGAGAGSSGAQKGAHGSAAAGSGAVAGPGTAGSSGSGAGGSAAGAGSGSAPGGASGAGASGSSGSGAGAAAGTGTAAGSGAAAASGSGAGAVAGSADAPASATLGVDKATAVAGHAMSFVAQGFVPGEQVVGSFDDGVLAVGPLTAGNQGEVAGILALPDGTRVGTHVLRLTGATSGQAPQVEVTVRRDAAEANAADAARAAALAAARSDDGWSPAEVAVGVAALVLLAVVLSSFVTARRRRRRDRAAAAASAVPEPASSPEPTTEAASASSSPEPVPAEGEATPTSTVPVVDAPEPAGTHA